MSVSTRFRSVWAFAVTVVFACVLLVAWGSNSALAADCNNNGVEDEKDLGGVSEDCNGNSFPDECEGIPLRFRLAQLVSNINRGTQSLASGDVDGDGLSDVITATRLTSGKGMQLTLNGEDGTFSRPQVLASSRGRRIYTIALSDVDVDGDKDIVTASVEMILVFINNGAGSFSLPAEYATAPDPADEDPDPEGNSRFAIAADLTGDGAPEIIAANRHVAFLSVFPNKGDGTFGALINYPCGDDPQALTAGDFDGDGTMDIAAVNKGTKDFAILLNNGDGTLREPQSYALGNGTPESLEADDFNRDGHLDLVTIVSSKVSVLMTGGDGTFEEVKAIDLGDLVGGIATADFDRDGDVDFAVSLRRDPFVIFAMNDGNGEFPVLTRSTLLGRPTAITAEEVSGDKEVDVVVTLSIPEAFTVLANGVVGELPVEIRDLSLFGCTDQGRGCHPHSGAAFDFDGDGDLDVIGANTHPGDFSLAVNDGNGVLTIAGAAHFGGQHPQSVGPGDFDLDGDIDVITPDNLDHDIWVHENRGDGRFLPPVRYRLAPGSAPINVQIADFDDDGDLDAATADQQAGTVTVMFNDVREGARSLGGRVFSNHGFRSPRVGRSPKALAVADYDGDGDVDIASANSQGLEIAVILNTGDGSFESITKYRMGSNPNHVTHGDVDGDGRVDLITANGGDQREERIAESTISVFLGLGNGTFGEERQFRVIGNSYSVEVFDFDLDGNVDAVTANEEQGTVSFLFGDGTGRFGPSTNLEVGDGARFLVPGDYDVDGDIDFVTLNRLGKTFTHIVNLSSESELLFVDSLCTHLDFHNLSLKAGPTSPIDRFLKYIVPAKDNPDLLPTAFQNSNAFELHIDFLRGAFPDRFGALTTDEYARMVERSATRQYYVGSIARILTDEGELVYGFNFFARFNDLAERPTVGDAKKIYDRISQSFHLEPLVYFPLDTIAREVAEEWAAAGDPGFPILVESTVPPFEPYTGGVSYGRLRLMTKEEFEEADEKGEFSFQDGVIVEHAPRDIQGVVAFVATGERQGELSHLSIRTNRRGTPNCLVRDALEVFAPWDGKLVRFEVTGRGFLIEEATQEDAEAFWSENRPSLNVLPAIDEEYDGLPTFDEIVAMEDAGVPIVPRVGGKASNLARLRKILTGEWAQYQETGFAIPVRYYLEFMRSNQMPSALDPARQVTYEEYLRELSANAEFQSNPSYRFEVLDDLRDHIRDEGVVNPDLVQAVGARVLEVMGTPSTTRVRFRSSSNIEDDVQFNGAGLYNSTSGCLEDELDGDEEGPSHCDPEKANERTITRALKRVWRSLWRYGAFEERNYFQIEQDDAAMAVLVNRTFIDEASNGVAFTGNPQNPFDRRYVITIQQAEESVVSPEPGVEAEKDLLEIVDGAVNKVIRSLPSTLVPPGTFVVSEEQLHELGRLMAYIDANFPVDAGEFDPSQILLDMEFKFMQDGELAVKQVRPFLLSTSLPPPPTFELEIPAGTMACGVLSQGRGNRAEFAVKAQVRFASGVHMLPAGAGAFSGELFEELVFGQDRLVATPAGSGTFRFTRVSSGNAIDWTVTYRFDFEQEMTLPGGESLLLKLDNVEYLTRSSDNPIPLRRVLDEEYIVSRGTFLLSTEIPHTLELPPLGPRSEESPAVDVFFGSCTHHTLPLFEIRAELADGTSLFLEERYDAPPEGTLRDLSAAALTRADVSFPEVRLEVADYWSLSYTAERHNTHLEYWMALDPPVTVTGVEKPVHVVELIAPQPEETPPIVETARYLGENFEVLTEIEVLSFERIDPEDQRRIEPFRRGDVDQDGDVTISDAQTIVSYLFQRGDRPACRKSADTNDNGETTVTDALEILFYLFRSGHTLPGPFAQCGHDGTNDPLSCRTFVPCE